MISNSVRLTDRAYNFSLTLIKYIDGLPRDATSRVISNQLLRSGTSVGANLVEAKASSSRREFKKFQEISLKSANETIYWLGLLRDSNKTVSNDLNVLIDEATQLSKMIVAGIIKLKASKINL